MRILVTGASGFIGNYVSMKLIELGHKVIASSANIEKAKAKDWFNSVEYVRFDFDSFNESTNYFDYFLKPDVMIHLGWEGLPNFKDSFHIEENLPRHERLLQNMIMNGLADLTVTGTCLEYGMRSGELIENMPVEPTVAYAIAKNSLRIFLQQIQFKYPVNLKWIRLFYMYGKGQNPKSLLSQLQKTLDEQETVFNMSGGDQTRDFLPIEEVAEYIIKTALQTSVTGIINCSSGVPVTVKSLVETYLARQHKSIKLNLGYYPYPDYEPMHFWGDNTKLKTILKNE